MLRVCFEFQKRLLDLGPLNRAGTAKTLGTVGMNVDYQMAISHGKGMVWV